MKIALVAHNVMLGDGQSTMMHALAKHALAAGHHVTLVANYVDPTLLAAGALHFPIPITLRKPHLVKVWEFACRADRWAAKFAPDYDVVHAVGFSLTAKHTVNTCQFVHGAWKSSSGGYSQSFGGPYAWYQRNYTLANAHWEKSAFRSATSIVAVSGTIRRELIQIGVAPDVITVIPNGVDLTQFGPGKSMRVALGLPQQAKLFLFSGDIRTKRKNLDTVLKAMRQLPSSFHLVVAGDTRRSPFVRQAEMLGIRDRVHFIGFRGDLPDVMRAVNAFVFPSRYEACALVLLEAAASGLPIITASATGGSEFIDRNAGRFLDDPNDVDQLASFMLQIGESEQLRDTMAIAARKSAEACSWERVCSEYMKLYGG